jgi:hypothetical protein
VNVERRESGNGKGDGLKVSEPDVNPSVNFREPPGYYCELEIVTNHAS